MVNPIQDQLLEIKKSHFMKAVKTAAESRNLPIPPVKFWECPNFTGNEMAHIHNEEEGWTICVSKKRLIEMNFDILDDVAAHEVSHMFEFNHEPAFHAQQQTTRIESWKSKYTPKKQQNNEKTSTPIKHASDKKRCNYHLCRKENIELHKCKYCNNYFCKDHLKAIEPLLMNSGAHHYRQDTGNINAHPCPKIVNYVSTEEIDTDKISKDIDSIYNEIKNCDTTIQKSKETKQKNEVILKKHKNKKIKNETSLINDIDNQLMEIEKMEKALEEKQFKIKKSKKTMLQKILKWIPFI